MKCEDIRERMPDVAAGLSQPTSAENNHLASCTSCADQLKAMRETMSLLDEWQVPIAITTASGARGFLAGVSLARDLRGECKIHHVVVSYRDEPGSQSRARYAP
jgi:hypothetical protein